jgi:hypothetical protein
MDSERLQAPQSRVGFKITARIDASYGARRYEGEISCSDPSKRSRDPILVIAIITGIMPIAQLIGCERNIIKHGNCAQKYRSSVALLARPLLLAAARSIIAAMPHSEFKHTRTVVCSRFNSRRTHQA